MKLCPKCEYPYLCCDHCAYFEFNGDEQGRYTNNGWCRLHKRAEDPGSLCDDYFCFELLKKDAPNVDASTSS
jgi:hypothetical protein